MRLTLPWLAILALGCGAGTPPALPAAPAPPSPPPASEPAREPAKLDPQVGPWIDAYVQAFGKHWGDAHAFNGFVAIGSEGRILWSAAYGKANRDTGAVATATTRFRIGSVTKPITALAIVKLAERGRLSVDDPVRKYVPSLPAAFERVTIHHLLTHTSGIFSYTNDEAFMKERGQRKTQEQVVAVFRDKPLAFAPGSTYAYSNSNYFLLGMVLEKVTGTLYDAWLQANVFAPAGMHSTSTADLPDSPDAAVGYCVEEEALTRCPPIDMSTPFAAGAIRSTAADLVAWEAALSGSKLVGDAWKARMFQVFKGDYAYGWSRREFEGHEVRAHSGGIDGFTSYFVRADRARLVVVALSNAETVDAGDVAKAALRMALSGKKVDPPEEKALAPFDAKAAAAMAGDYALTDASRAAAEGKLPKEVVESVIGLTITVEGERVRAKPSGQRGFRIYPGVEGGYFSKGSGITVSAVMEKGRVAGVSLRQAGLELKYARRAKGKK